MIRWYMNFLKNRISIAEILGVKLSIWPVCGTPQGGVLSSRIWNLAFDPLLRLLNDNQPCSPVGFADDGALCFRGICPHTLVEIAQPFINKAVEWGAQNGPLILSGQNICRIFHQNIQFLYQWIKGGYSLHYSFWKHDLFRCCTGQKS